MRSNFHHNNIVGVSFEPQTLNSGGTASATGATILEPQIKGRDVVFVLVGGDFATTVDGTGVIQGRLRSDHTTWEQLKEDDGVTGLAFDEALFANDSELEDGVVIGTLPAERIDWETYDAVRIVVTATAAANMVIGCVHIIGGTLAVPSGQEDNLFAKVRPS